MFNASQFENKINELTLTLNAIEKREHEKRYSTQADPIYWKDRGRKFAAIDIRNCGAWLIEKANGEIYNIKGYGVPDYNKKKKSDIGNIETVDAERMHRLRWNYLR